MGSEGLEQFHPAVREWFSTSFPVPTPAQTGAWPPIAAGESTLLMAPTGSGKTLAAFLSSIDTLIQSPPAGAALKDVETVIVDEIHAMVSTKRGSHLAVTLERLERLVAPHLKEKGRTALQRIGLSATQRPLEEVARFLGGFGEDGPRPV